jgi:hypothetical protein
MTKVLASAVIALAMTVGAVVSTDEVARSTGSIIAAISDASNATLTTAQARDSSVALSRPVRGTHALRHARTGRGPRRPAGIRRVESPRPPPVAATRSRLQARHAQVPSRYLLLHYRIAPRAPSLI